MNTVELLKFSMDSAFDVLGMVTADLTQDMIDWMPPGKTSSIAANYSHILVYSTNILENILVPCDDKLFRSYPLPEIQLHNIQADLSELHKSAGEVKKAYDNWLSSLTPEDLETEMNTSVGPLNIGQVVGLYVVWHINVHCGEISALKGCQGAKGYPW